MCTLLNMTTKYSKYGTRFSRILSFAVLKSRLFMIHHTISCVQVVPKSIAKKIKSCIICVSYDRK